VELIVSLALCLVLLPNDHDGVRGTTRNYALFTICCGFATLLIPYIMPGYLLFALGAGIALIIDHGFCKAVSVKVLHYYLATSPLTLPLGCGWLFIIRVQQSGQCLSNGTCAHGVCLDYNAWFLPTFHGVVDLGANEFSNIQFQH
jgi:hypothetical protein